MSTFLNNVKLYFVKCNPKRPNTRMDPTKPRWEVQIRTDSQEEALEWEAKGLTPKFVIPKGGTPADGFWRQNLSKNALKKDGSAAQPVETVTGNLSPLDPDTIGNGSVGNLRLLSREYEMGGVKKLAWYLMGVQVTHLIPYEGNQAEGFSATDFKVEATQDEDDLDEDDFKPQDTVTAAPPSVKLPAGRSADDF